MKAKDLAALLTMFSLAIQGCSDSGGSSGGSSVSGIDLSGTYALTQLECYTSSGSLSQFGPISSGAATIVISGNSYSSSISDSDCDVELSSDIVFYSDNSYDISGVNVSSATGGSCTISYAVTEQNGSAGSLNVNPVSIAYIEGADSDATNTYGYNESNEALAFFVSGLTVTGTSDNCFVVYLKQ